MKLAGCQSVRTLYCPKLKACTSGRQSRHGVSTRRSIQRRACAALCSCTRLCSPYHSAKSSCPEQHKICTTRYLSPHTRCVASFAPAWLANGTLAEPGSSRQRFADPGNHSGTLRSLSTSKALSSQCSSVEEGFPCVQAGADTPGPMASDALGFPLMSQDCLSWFAARKISPTTLLRNQITEEHLQLSKKHPEKETAIVFPYLLHGKVTNKKLRTLGRRFASDTRYQSIWYGLDDIIAQDTIIIVEGEMDKLSMEEAGFTNVLSVPHGAPRVVKQGPLPEPSKDKAFAYVWNCWLALEHASCILLATDDDVPGHALAEELARRLGRGRCLRVSWADTDPAAAGSAPSKDANDVLVQRGPEGVQHCIQQAKPLPNRMQYMTAAN